MADVKVGGLDGYSIGALMGRFVTHLQYNSYLNMYFTIQTFLYHILGWNAHKVGVISQFLCRYLLFMSLSIYFTIMFCAVKVSITGAYSTMT